MLLWSHADCIEVKVKTSNKLSADSLIWGQICDYRQTLKVMLNPRRLFLQQTSWRGAGGALIGWEVVWDFQVMNWWTDCRSKTHTEVRWRDNNKKQDKGATMILSSSRLTNAALHVLFHKKINDDVQEARRASDLCGGWGGRNLPLINTGN